MLRKIINGEVCVNRSSIVPAPARLRRKHPHQLNQIRCRTQYRQASFFPRTIRDWNELPETTVAADTLETFKSRVPFSQ